MRSGGKTTEALKGHSNVHVSCELDYDTAPCISEN